MGVTHFGEWKPISLDSVAELFGTADFPWWIAGGWAIDLFVGRQTREHADIDVLVLRKDHGELRHHLAGWDLHAADPPGSLRPWLLGETLHDGVHDIWCRRTPTSPWSVQVMLDEAAGDEWVYRRDPRVRRALAELSGPASTPTHPVLAPEVQLLYKSKNPRAKDVEDFNVARELMADGQLRWLDDALAITSPENPWRIWL